MSKIAMKVVATAAVMSILLTAATAQAAGADPVKGGVIFNAKCGGCHSDVSGKNMVGPSLFGVYGRASGTAPGYTYSSGLKASGIVWTSDNLTAWLTKPKAVVPGTKMSFAPPTTAEEKVDLIAYLKSKK